MVQRSALIYKNHSMTNNVRSYKKKPRAQIKSCTSCYTEGFYYLEIKAYVSATSFQMRGGITSPLLILKGRCRD